MFAIFIDPEVCHTWAGWLIPECYGILVMAGCALGAALSAVTVRTVKAVRAS